MNYVNKVIAPVLVGLLLSACAGDPNAHFADGDPVNPVIGNPNALGTAGFPPVQAVRGRMYAMMGITAPNTALNTFVTTNRNVFNGTGEAKAVTPEEIQKRVEGNYIACTAGIAARTSNHFGPMFTGVNFGQGPSTITDAKLEQIASSMRQVFTGQTNTPAETLQMVREFRTDFVAGATNNGTLTTNLMISLCTMLASSPLAMSVM